MASVRRYRSYFDYWSGRAEYLFVHIPKNAGVAMRRAAELRGRLIAVEPLFFRCRDHYGRLRQTMRERGEHHGVQHARLSDLAPRVRRRLRPVAVVRNPWARVVSRFRFAQLVVGQGKAPDGYAADSFEAFLEERHEYGDREFYWHRAVRGWSPQVDYVVDESGAVACDLLRQECLSDDAKRYFGLREGIRRRNTTKGRKKPYQAFYSPKSIQIVADWYARDVETFGFDFDTQATRNCHYSAPDDGARRCARGAA